MIDGAFTSGPVRVGDRVFFPVNEAGWDKPFEFSIWSKGPRESWTKVGGESLNQGFGQAQGDLYGVCKSVWAIWTETKVEGQQFGDWFPVETYAAMLKPDGSGFLEPLRLWQGNLFFPTSSRMSCFRGRPVFAYTRQFSSDGGSHATVDLRSPAQIRAQMAE